MKWIGKVAGGILGALALGPVGAALGVLVGHQFDEPDSEDARPGTPEELAAIGERFFRATFRVMGCLAKADGRVSELEISAARAIMGELRLGAAEVSAAIACFTEGKQPQFDLAAELDALGSACRGRPDLARVFLEIQMRAALAGNNLEGPVRPLIRRIAASLGVSALELAHIEAVLRIQRGAFRAAAAAAGAGAAPNATPGALRDRELEAAYRVLESSAAATDEDVAKAYRRQLQRHHPDKLKAHGLPESMMAHAKQRTQQIIEAWELVRMRRGIH
jgi:DnaJ like chaperone protein